MKYGLVLEGGAMRGMFTCGVTDVMMENGIHFDGLCGVSAGAAFGCNYVSKQPGRAIRYNVKYSRDPRFCSFRSLIKTGDMFGADFCYREIPDELDLFDKDTFDSSVTEFHVVATDVDTGNPVYHRCDKISRETMEWMRASASMPLVSRVVEVDGYRLLDGGITDSVPLEYFESIGFGRCVVVLTQPKGYVKNPNALLPLMRVVLRKYPRLIDAIAHRHEMYNSAVKYVFDAEAAGRAFVICPRESLDISRTEDDPRELMRVYELGRAEAQRRLDEMRMFLS